LIHEDHPIKGSDVERGESALKLDALKARLQAEQVVNYFTSPADLRAHVIHSLSHYRQPMATPSQQTQLASLNTRPYHNLPQPDYIRFVGRQKEIDILHRYLAPDDRAWQILKTPPSKERRVLSGASTLPVSPAETGEPALVWLHSDFEADGLRLWEHQSFEARTAPHSPVVEPARVRPAASPPKLPRGSRSERTTG
jgi:hypothetical protein